jgi:glycine oxidase
MLRRKRIIVGGGIIGLATGWRLLREGAEHVEIFEAGEAGRSGAAWVAAGMVSPKAEAGFEDLDIYEDGVRSLSLYPQFLEELAEDSTVAVPQLDRSGTLLLATNPDEVREIDRQFDFRNRVGVPSKRWNGDEAREHEPLLSSKVRAALWLEGDAQINNRALLLALKSAFESRGGILHEHTPVNEVVTRGDRAVAVRTNSEEHEAQNITIAAGAWSSKIGGFVPNITVRPVKGQVIGLRGQPFAKLKQPIRTTKVYLVPKDDGRLLLGATAEEVGFDKRVIAGPIMEMLHRAWEIVPAIYELEIEEVLASFRPATIDHRPIIGPSNIEGLYYATGHWRHGILMTPLASTTLAKQIMATKPATHYEEAVA